MKAVCKCGSYAINHHCHGRDGSDGDLCDVCYWRKRAEQPAQQQPAPANLWLYWKVDDKCVVTGPFKTHSKDEAYGLDCIDQTPLTVAAPQPAQQWTDEAAKVPDNLWDGGCVLGHCGSPTGCELSDRCRADCTSPQAQPAQQQEPVAWLHPANATCVTTDPTAYARGIPLYTSPPAQRTWVGLTDDEILYCVELENPKAIAEEVESKLKEKNT